MKYKNTRIRNLFFLLSGLQVTVTCVVLCNVQYCSLQRAILFFATCNTVLCNMQYCSLQRALLFFATCNTVLCSVKRKKHMGMGLELLN